MQFTWYCLLASVVVALLPIITEGGPVQNTSRSSGHSGSPEHTTGEDSLLKSVTETPKSKNHHHWEAFKKTHRPNGYESIKEELYRNGIFEYNKKIIDEHNDNYAKNLTTYTMGVNQFSDMTVQEFSRIMNRHGKDNHTSNSTVSRLPRASRPARSIPTAIDWRNHGWVTPVKNQGRCGSCWAFSVTGAIEGQNARKNGRLVSLSEQNLIDCSSSYGTYGCNGAWNEYAYNYIRANKGIDTEASYPYTGVQGRCRYSSAYIGAKITGYVKLPAGKEQSLQQAVGTIGPVSVVIDASHASFQHYLSGIYNEVSCSTSSLDHAVLAVGYGNMNGRDYWIVKNSWGTTWGNNGYIYMSRNRNNQCGIASYAIYPTV